MKQEQLTLAEVEFDAEGRVHGDGRRKVRPSYAYIRAAGAGYLGAPRALRMWVVRATIEQLLEKGELAHSALGITCWVVQDWAHLTGRRVQISELWEHGRVVGYHSKLV